MICFSGPIPGACRFAATLAYATARAERSAELMLNQVSLAYGQRNKNRIASLYDKNAVSADDIDKAETDA